MSGSFLMAIKAAIIRLAAREADRDNVGLPVIMLASVLPIDCTNNMM
jgi:hypothetical protein